MKMFAAWRSLAALSGGLWLAACHHPADPNPGGCELTYSYSSNYFTYVYSAAGQLTGARTVTIAETHYDYTYVGSRVTLPVTYGPGGYWDYWELTLNAQGYVASAVDTYYGIPGRPLKQQATFGYDASGHLTGYHSDLYALGVPATPSRSLRIRFDYQNGDLTQVFDSLSSTLIKIDHSPQANPLRIPLLVENSGLPSIYSIERGLLPLLGKPTAHLISALRIVQPANPYSYSATFTYMLDSNGQLITFTTNTGSPTTYTLSSTCP